jgi:hypothetical protein
MTLRDYFREHGIEETTLKGDPAEPEDNPVRIEQWDLEIADVTEVSRGTLLTMSDQSGVWLGNR